MRSSADAAKPLVPRSSDSLAGPCAKGGAPPAPPCAISLGRTLAGGPRRIGASPAVGSRRIGGPVNPLKGPAAWGSSKLASLSLTPDRLIHHPSWVDGATSLGHPATLASGDGHARSASREAEGTAR